jgi:hypothetical protein
VVWVKRWALDTREEVDGAGLVDPRVTHLWDAGKVIGDGFLDRFGVTFGGLDYDFFLLFDPDATWGERAPRPVSSGATVIGASDRPGRQHRGPAALITPRISLANLVASGATTGATIAPPAPGVDS